MQPAVVFCCTGPKRIGSTSHRRGAMDLAFDVARSPSQVHHHLLWVWPEGGTDAMLESAQKHPQVIPELADESKVIYISKWCEVSWSTS